MGIPKFFRWISDRYPLSSALVTETSVPEFDNLYLDMNGIIHGASHPPSDDGTVTPARPEHLVFREIFAYVELLFAKVRPRKLLFLAVDGVAPRAKLNQQRSRRFRTALESAQNRTDEQDPEAVFDSNCITPGTRFMERLQAHLEYFIAAKMRDSVWRGVRVVLSGPAEPGEGEHKIMQYIRAAKSQPDYDNTTRHCLYGLDADLILLGLLSHDSHFALLREEVKFGRTDNKKKKRMKQSTGTSMHNTRFYLMHLGLVRDYIYEEFLLLPGVQDKLSVERVIDDIILLTILIGNDFLPHLPNLHVGENALGILFDAYKAVRPQLKGYLNEAGRVQFDRLALVLSRLRTFELERAVEELGGLDIPQAPSNVYTVSQKALLDGIVTMLFHDNQARWESSEPLGPLDRAFIGTVAHHFNLSLSVDPIKQTTILIKQYIEHADSEVDLDGAVEDESASQVALQRAMAKFKGIRIVPDDYMQATADRIEEAENDALLDWKMAYYRAKMNISSSDQVSQLVRSFAEGLQWVIDYYYKGVASWSWFYPYHYAPHLGDLAIGIANVPPDAIQFELGEPLTPLEQLMAVLPVASSSLVPACLANLMTGQLSDLYPPEFKQDLNGKRNAWEAVVLIPFIDERRLRTAVRGRLELLSVEEKRRNQFGPPKSFEFASASARLLSSPDPDHLPAIVDCQCKVIDWQLPAVRSGYGFFESTLDDIVNNPLPGFPTLRRADLKDSLSIVPTLEPVGVKLFAPHPSPHPSLVLSVRLNNNGSLERFSNTERVLVGWPFLQEAFFDSAIDLNTGMKVAGDGRQTRLSQRALGEAELQASTVCDRLLHGCAVRAPADQLIAVRRVIGDIIDADGDVHKSVEPELSYWPGQLVVADSEIVRGLADSRHSRLTISEMYPLGCFACYIGDPDCYGELAMLLSVNASAKTAEIELDYYKSDVEVNQLAESLFSQQETRLKFIPQRVVARQLQLSPILISRLASSLSLFDDLDPKMPIDKQQRVDIGLRWKAEGRGLFAEGLCRRSSAASPSPGYGGGQIEYSEKAKSTLLSYSAAFPDLFSALNSIIRQERIALSEVFTLDPSVSSTQHRANVRSYMTKVKRWLRENNGNVELLGESSRRLDSLSCSKLSLAINLQGKRVHQKHKVPLKTLLSPATAQDRLALQSENRSFNLGDRVRYIGLLYGFGVAGTVVGVLSSKDEDSDVEVLLDAPIVGLAGDLSGRVEAGKGICVPGFELLNTTSPSVLVKPNVQTDRTMEKPRKLSVTELFTAASKIPVFSPQQPPSEEQICSISDMLRSASLQPDTRSDKKGLRPAPQFPKRP